MSAACRSRTASAVRNSPGHLQRAPRWAPQLEDADMDRRLGLRAGCHRPEAAEARGVALHIDADVLGDSI
jgi:hypothetical protein